MYLSFISYPSTRTIAGRYLDAVIDEDLTAAIGLARSNYACQHALRQAALLDIQEFGGDAVRNVSIKLRYNVGSDDEIQFADISFEHLVPGQRVWQSGSMTLVTDFDVPGFRYLCGNLTRSP